MDKERAVAFAAKAKEKSDVVPFEDNPNRAAVTVGADEDPLPIPLVKNKGKWTFDTKIGREEVLNRRIGANELDAIAICRGFVEAQHEYAAEKRDGAKVNQYAQRIISTEGKKDGLAWKNPDGSWGGIGWRRSRKGDRARLLKTRSAVPWLLLQGAEGARPGGADG